MLSILRKTYSYGAFSVAFGCEFCSFVERSSGQLCFSDLEGVL